MGWRIVVQPNGKYARFSEVVDNFTDLNLSREEAISICKGYIGVGEVEAEDRVKRAEDSPGRWEEAIKIVGEEKANQVLEYLKERY